MRMAWRLMHNPNPKIQAKYAGTVRQVNGKAVWTGKINLDEETLLAPLRWRKPRRVFVNSMSDLFHENVSAAMIDKVFAVMAASSRHTYQVLTKRPERMRDEMLRLSRTINPLEAEARAFGYTFNSEGHSLLRWPIPNVWLGTSVEDIKRKDRIDELRETPAAVRFLSLEPLLEDLGELDLTGLHWVIVGGESGPNARPMHPDWARSIRDQCQAAGVPFFFKQWGNQHPNGQVLRGDQGFTRMDVKRSGRLLDWREWNEFPG